MPIVRIDIQSGKSTAYKRQILHGVRDAVTSALGVPDDRVMQRIIETPAEDIDATDIRSDKLTVVEVSMLSGRGPELKGELFRAMSRRLGLEPGIEPHDLVVIVNDPPGECFFLNGAQACEPAWPAEGEQARSAAADAAAEDSPWAPDSEDGS